MDVSSWFSSYLLDNDEGLDTSALLRDFAEELTGSKDLNALNASELAIVDACIHGVIWGYPLQETYRLRMLDTSLQAPKNELFKPSYAANWLNKHSSPAPDSSVLYVTGWLDLSEEQVLHTPSNPDDHYYVWAILDSTINTVGSIGPRTQSESERIEGAYYLLCGPSSPYYASPNWTTTIRTTTGHQTAQIIKVDTPYAWVTARFAANTLSEADLARTRLFINGSSEESGSGFQLGSLQAFKDSGTVAYNTPIQESKTDQRIEDRYGRVPSLARVFFEQLGLSLLDNPIPTERTNEVDSPIPSDAVWLGNQNQVQQNPLGTDNNYIPDRDYQPTSALSNSQLTELNERFSHIGLNLSSGFELPDNWSEKERLLFQSSYQFAQSLLNKATTEIASGKETTNYWHISNLNIGVYPNTWENWLVRAGVAIDGGAANIPNDGVYPTSQKDQQGHALRSTYNYTITLPKLSKSTGASVYAPADGFWSYTIYQPDPGNAYQPFLIENAISNLSYSRTNATATLTADGWLRTSKPGDWNSGTALGTALHSSTVEIAGLTESTTYYISDYKSDPVDADTLLIKLSETYTPDYNWLGLDGTKGVPIGGQGSPGPSLNLSGSEGSELQFAWIQPVSQLGSAQSDSLEVNSKGEIVLQLRAHQPSRGISNWLPTPSQGYVADAYNFQVMARYYEPTWADGMSVLAKEGSEQQYLPPQVTRTSLDRLAIWRDLDPSSQALLQERTGSSSIDPFSRTDPYDPDSVGALLDLRWADGALEGTKWSLNFSYQRNGSYTNRLYFYKVDDLTGQLGTHSPGDVGYMDVALARRINANDPIINGQNNTTISGSLELEGGSIYMPLVVTEAGQNILPNARSSLNYNHFSLESSRSFAFEDLIQGGDHDHNDGLFTVTGLTALS